MLIDLCHDFRFAALYGRISSTNRSSVRIPYIVTLLELCELGHAFVLVDTVVVRNNAFSIYSSLGQGSLRVPYQDGLIIYLRSAFCYRSSKFLNGPFSSRHFPSSCHRESCVKIDDTAHLLATPWVNEVRQLVQLLDGEVTILILMPTKPHPVRAELSRPARLSTPAACPSKKSPTVNKTQCPTTTHCYRISFRAESRYYAACFPYPLSAHP